MMAACAETGNPGTGTLMPLNEAFNPETCGRKAAALANLRSEGFNVPEGWVVPAELARTLALAEIANPESLFDHLPDTPLAVRSSGVSEDGDDESLAGQFETVLNVVGADAVIDAVRTVVESAGSSDIAVLIQPMIDPDAAGASFSANPVTGNRDEVVVNAVLGLGDRLMDGTAEAEEWVVTWNAVERRSDGQSVLTADSARRIASLAQEVERVAGSPQDIEWAMCGEELFLLQSRPITALPVEPQLQPLPDDYWQKELEHLTPPVSPMFFSIHQSNFREATRTAFARFGMLIDSLELAYRSGEVYQRSVPLGGKSGPPPWWVLGALTRVVPELRHRMKAAQRAIRTDLEAQMLQYWDTVWKQEMEQAAVEMRRIDLGALSVHELAGHLESVRELTRQGFSIHFQLAIPIMLAVHRLVALCAELFGWDDLRALQLLGGSSSESSASSRDLDRIANLARRDYAALELLTDPSATLEQLEYESPMIAAEINAYLQTHGDWLIENDVSSRTFLEVPSLTLRVLRDRLTSAGTDTAIKAAAPEAPAEEEIESLLEMRSTSDRGRFHHALVRARWAYGLRDENVHIAVARPFAILRYALLEAGQRLVDRRVLGRVDDVFYCQFEEVQESLTGESSTNLGETAHRRRMECLWTSANPGPESFGTDAGLPDIRALPREARQLHEAMFWSLSRSFASGTGEAGGLHGVPASPGQYQGAVRIIRGEQDFSRLNVGDVLVCPSTTSSWGVLFGTAGALVTDMGGSLSHPAILAREHGIPAVVATGNATETLVDGQVVIVDGSSGRIEIVEARREKGQCADHDARIQAHRG